MQSNQRLIVGLGNPGKEYEKTRHNVGFEVVELFAKLNHIPLTKRSGRAIVGDGLVSDVRVFVMEPQTYMNLSGEAAAAFLRQKPIAPTEIIVITDDINLPVGKIRIRAGGSDGGHNGLKSLTAHLHTKDYPRMRIGVGGPPDTAFQVDFVLGKFNPTDRKLVDETIERAVAALETWVREGIAPAMNKFNG
ncbi:MAG TPA: aminoacyl-tRNA hydrolase [Capsulimonadaceae bacterium]|jgi:PTH1 family peptidyl-tRNA hydrolase